MPSIDSRQRMPRIFPQSRRAFLQGLAAACVPAALPWSAARAQMPPRPTAIDVHHHWYSMELLKSWGRDTFDPNWTTAASLARMDEAGVATSMLSITMPGIWKSSDVTASAALARQCNERMTQTAHDHPGRFGVLAALPLPQTDASLAEIAYALDVLHADGIGLLSNYDSVPLGDARFAPVFEELNRRKAVVYIHPMAPACCTGLVPGLGVGALEAPTDTARSIASLLITGTLSRLTDMQVVVGAGGGTLPFIGDRLISSATQAGRNAAEPDKKYFAPDALRAALGRLHLDTAGVTNPADWAALMNFTTPGQLLFGSDSPFATDAQCLEQLRAMEQRFGLPAADASAIEYGNAQKLFPARFKPKP
jgi:predicted TIM-barrel fold metal-dependent hydrolase